MSTPFQLILGEIQSDGYAYDANTGLWVPLNVDAAGNLKVNIAAGSSAGGTSSSYGAAFPATGTAAGASDGVNMQPLLVDGAGKLLIAGSFASSPTTATTRNAGTKANSASSQMVLAATPLRLGFSCHNDCSVRALLKLGVTASGADFDIPLLPQERISLNAYLGLLWLGRIDVIWDAVDIDTGSPNKVLRYLELTV